MAKSSTAQPLLVSTGEGDMPAFLSAHDGAPTPLFLVRPYSLAQEFAFAPPRRLPGSHTLTNIQKRFVLYQVANGEARSAIGRIIDTPTRTVTTFIEGAEGDSRVFIAVEFVLRARSWVGGAGARRSPTRWWCRYCGMPFRSSARAGKHAWDHAFEPGWNW